MRIHWDDLAEAMEGLMPDQRDAIIKIFQEEMPIADYAKEQGISRRMAYYRMQGILDLLLEMLGRSMMKDACRDRHGARNRRNCRRPNDLCPGSSGTRQ